MLRLPQREGIAVELNSTIPMTDGSVIEQVYDFRIKAVADGGSIMMKHIQVRIIVCRYETISAVNTELNSTIYIAPRAPTNFVVNHMFTSNDTYCPVNRLSLHTSAPTNTSAAVSPSLKQLQTFFLNTSQTGETILNLMSTFTGTYEFYLLGQTVTSKHVYIPFTLYIECAPYSQVFTPKLPEQYYFEVFKNEGT
jgi:hypothetical protein